MAFWLVAVLAAMVSSQKILVDVNCAGCACKFEYSGNLETASPLMVSASPSCVGEYHDRINAGLFMAEFAAWSADNASLPVDKLQDGVFVIRDAARLDRLNYVINISNEQINFGEVLASSHCDDAHTHILLSGYASFAWLHGKEDYAFEVQVTPPSPTWNVFASLVAEDNLFQASSYFQLLDSPILMGDPVFTSAHAIPASAPINNTLLAIWTHSPLSQALLDKIARAVSIATAAMAELGALPMPHNYTAFFELFPADAPSLGWALEHQASFQAMDSAESFANFTDLRLAYHCTHHMYHSYFVPRRVYTDHLQPDVCWQFCVSGFIWFAEGFAQYNAFLPLAQRFPLTDVLQALSQRFAAPYLTTPFPNASMVNISTAISLGNKDLWVFMYSAGALLGMMLDASMRASTCGFGLHEAIGSLHGWIDQHGGQGIPEDSFEAVFLNATVYSIEFLFAAYVRAPAPLPVEAILAGAGVDVVDSPQGITFAVRPSSECSETVRRFRRCAFGTED